jgi:hypothetical protein
MHLTGAYDEVVLTSRKAIYLFDERAGLGRSKRELERSSAITAASMERVPSKSSQTADSSFFGSRPFTEMPTEILAYSHTLNTTGPKRENCPLQILDMRD